MGPSWGPLGASWAHFGSHFPPPWGAPGRLQEVIFRLFWDVPAEIFKMSFCLLFFHICRVFFLCYYLPSVVFLAPWLAASCICKKLKIHWFLWVASHMRLVLATPEAVNFQWGRVINIGGKKSSKKGLTGPENKVKKGAFLSQHGSQNGPRRLPETCAQDGRHLKRPTTPPGAPQERHQTILKRFSSHTGIRALSEHYPSIIRAS